MKKFFLATMTLILGITINANAQEMGEWTWEQHHLSFKMPTNAEVVENTQTDFQAQTESLTLIIGLAEATKDDDLLLLTTNLASKTIVEDNERPVMTVLYNGLEGCIVKGKNPKNNNYEVASAVLQSQKTYFTIIVSIVYEKVDAGLANEILESIKLTD